MRMVKLATILGVTVMVFTGVFFAGNAAGQLPPGYACTGNCGTLGADGVVTLSPYGSSAYMYISTNGGASGAGVLPTGSLGSETNGSTLTSPMFSATAGEQLQFYFNYVTSDGAGFADYAWAAVENTTTDTWTYLVTARTEPSGSIIPGLGMPGVWGTLTPPSVPIIVVAPRVGHRWGVGREIALPLVAVTRVGFCRNTAFRLLGNYVLAFGTVNWD